MDYQKRYRDYLKSDHWARLRVESSNLWGDGCYVCKKHPVDFHHLTYRDLLNCTADDVIPLCRNCHQGTHFKPGKIFRAVRCAKTNDEKRSIIQTGMKAFIGERCTEAERDLVAYKKRVSDGKRVTIEAIRKDRRERAKADSQKPKKVSQKRPTWRDRSIRLKQQREHALAVSREQSEELVTVSVYNDGVLCRASAWETANKPG